MTPALARLRARLAGIPQAAKSGRYATALRGDDRVKRLIAGEWPMQWSTRYEFVSDDPLKVKMTEARGEAHAGGVGDLAKDQGGNGRATHHLALLRAGQGGDGRPSGAVGGGKQVGILTNSLVANDVAAVHGGYSRYRRPLLEGGVQLWELKPTAGSSGSSMFGSSGASLHTKAISIDGRTLFVGSYNLDPRSTWLNCEQGVLVEDELLAKQLDGIFATQTTGAHAWKVSVKDGGLHVERRHGDT